MLARQGESLRPPIVGSAYGLVFIIAAVLLMLLPMSPGPFKTLFIPHLVVVPVFFFTLRPAEGVGPVGAFAAGLSVDMLTFAPLGVTAASLLAVHLLLRHEREALRALPAGFRLAGFALALAFVLAVSLLSMAVLGAKGWPNLVEVGAVFAGLMVVGAGFELASSHLGFFNPRSGLGGGGRNSIGRGAKKRKTRRPVSKIRSGLVRAPRRGLVARRR